MKWNRKLAEAVEAKKKQLKFRSKTFRNAVTAKNLLDEIVAKIIILHFLRIFSLSYLSRRRQLVLRQTASIPTFNRNVIISTDIIILK